MADKSELPKLPQKIDFKPTQEQVDGISAEQWYGHWLHTDVHALMVQCAVDENGAVVSEETARRFFAGIKHKQWKTYYDKFILAVMAVDVNPTSGG